MQKYSRGHIVMTTSGHTGLIIDIHESKSISIGIMYSVLVGNAVLVLDESQISQNNVLTHR